MLQSLTSGVLKLIMASFKLTVTLAMWTMTGLFALASVYGTSGLALERGLNSPLALIVSFAVLLLSVMATLALWSPWALPWISAERLAFAQEQEGEGCLQSVLRLVATLFVWGVMGGFALGSLVGGGPLLTLLGLASLALWIVTTLSLWSPATLPWIDVQRLSMMQGQAAYTNAESAKRKREESAKRKRAASSPYDDELQAALALLSDDERAALAREVRRRILEDSLDSDGEFGAISLEELLRGQHRR
jgi:hypothetical protein